MNLNRAAIVDSNFINKIIQQDLPAAISNTTMQQADLSKIQSIELFQTQLESRHLDLIARKLREENQGFYTIGSSGHEGNAAVACAAEVKDMAFLHYRSLAFMLYRARQFYNGDPKILDHLLALVAAKADPIASGRHKVFGSLSLNVPPQTSTIASHLPKAVGAAFSLAMAKSLQIEPKIDPSAVILCSFGDASLNHSTTQGALNSAAWITAHNMPLPIVFICEDNNIGISVPTQTDWIEKTSSRRYGIRYFLADGLNIFDVYKATKQAIDYSRINKKPVFLHIKMVRLLGHAGSDLEFQYNTPAQIEATEHNDPLLHTARIMLENKFLTKEEILSRYNTTREYIAKLVGSVITEPKLNNKQEVMCNIIPPKLNKKIPNVYMQNLAEIPVKLNLAESINKTLADLLSQYKNMVIFGEDVGKKGGIYRVTANLQQKFGVRRVFDTMLDEQTILGAAIGMAHNNILPIPEIQFLAYIYNAIDQLRGEAATLSFFSSGQFTNPMVIRLPSLAFQKGFGGHFHNDNALAFLREIPGIILVCPSNARDAALLLRKCVALAYQEQRVVVFIEPIALYRTKDLLVKNDAKWQFAYPNVEKIANFGEPSIWGDGNDFAIITYGNGCYLSNIAIDQLKSNYNLSGIIIDLNWLHPLPIDNIIIALNNIKKIIIIDECRKTGSISEEIITGLHEKKCKFSTLKRVTAEDSFIPLGDAWQYVLPSIDDIVKACIED
jgi:2-oxoisovalerate dehydrogenase E1 component